MDVAISNVDDGKKGICGVGVGVAVDSGIRDTRLATGSNRRLIPFFLGLICGLVGAFLGNVIEVVDPNIVQFLQRLF